MQTEITQGQVQPVISSMVAGVNWGQNFIAEEVLPPTNTYGEQFSYQVWDNVGLVDQGTTKRGLRAESKKLEPGATAMVPASLEDYSAKIPTDVREINAARVQDAIRPVPAEGMNAVDHLRYARSSEVHFNNQIQKEKAAAGLVFGAANYVLTDVLGALNFKTCKVSEIKQAMRDVQKLFGFMPDTFVLGWKSRLLFDDNQNLLDRVSGGATTSNPATVTDELLAKTFGVQRLVTGTPVVQPKALPGQAPASSTPLWTEDMASLIYTGVNATSNLVSAAFGKVFYMNYPETGVRYKVKTWLNDEGNVEWNLTAEMFLVAQVMKVGYLFTNTDV